MTKDENDLELNGEPTGHLHWRWSAQTIFDQQSGTIMCTETGDCLTLKPSVLQRLAPLTDNLVGSGLVDQAIRSMGSWQDGALLCAYLSRLLERLCIEWVYIVDQSEVAVFTPLVRGFRPELPRDISNEHISRYAYLRFIDGKSVLSSPVACCHAEFSAPGARAFVNVQARMCETGKGSPSELGTVLARFGFFESKTDEPNQALESWEFADALFHASSTRGRDLPVVGLNRSLQARFSLPVSYELTSGPHLRLPAQAPAELARSAVSATNQRRASCRDWSTQKLALADLSAFLSGLLKRRSELDGAQLASGSALPMAGDIDALGWFVVAGRIAELDVGLFRYSDEPLGLEVYEHSQKQARELLKAARASMNSPESEPHALIIQTLRLPPLSWRYSGMAYRLGLLDAGVAIHAMYLQATELGLGGCALGTVDPRPFEAATRRVWPNETPISAFALGLPA